MKKSSFITKQVKVICWCFDKLSSYMDCIVYDIIHKIQELELTGDKNAARIIERYEKIRRSGDSRASLDFERDILKIAQTEFELISDVELIDLTRVQADRNRCAHPALNAEDEIYLPTAELARVHLRNAFDILLKRPPIQGKAALSRLAQDINSDYFPQSIDEAYNYFSSGPLGRAKPSLVRNFVIMLLKDIFDHDIDLEKKTKLCIALQATGKLHPIYTQTTINEKLNDIIVQAQDQEMIYAVMFLSYFPDSWNYLKNDSKSRLQTFVKKLPNENLISGIAYSIKIPDLKNYAILRMNSVTYSQLISLVENNVYFPELVDMAVRGYIASGSFAEANSIAKYLIIPLGSHITANQIETLLEACAKNDQINHSNERNNVINHLKTLKIIPEITFDELLDKYGLKEIPI